MRRVLLSLARLSARIALVFGLALTAACSSPVDTSAPKPSDPAPDPGPSDRARLAAHAAAAEDLVGSFDYRLVTPGHDDRTIRVLRAADGGWRVDVPGGAHGGGVDIAVASTEAGLFQCRLGDITPGCVRLARLEPDIDPMVQHVFTDWPGVLTDRAAPLSVSAIPPLDGVPGACFAVEASTVSLVAPLDAGIYCYADDGVLTGARLSVGTLTLISSEPGPDSIHLPGPVIERKPLPTASPSLSAPTAPAPPAAP